MIFALKKEFSLKRIEISFRIKKKKTDIDLDITEPYDYDTIFFLILNIIYQNI